MINVNILRVAYNQYFCNMPIITDEDLLNIHYIVNEKLYKDEDIESWSDLHEDLLIWHPFEETSPAKIMENIDSLVKDIQINILPDPDTYLVINKLELASELAHQIVLDKFTISKKEWGFIQEDGDSYYTEEAQDIFNESYDYYLNLIENTA